MKFYILAVSLLLASSQVFASGLCTANQDNPNFSGLCKMFDKDACTLNARTCDWISNGDNGVCRANQENPSFAALCKMFDSNGCQLNARTCDWIDLD